MVSPVSFFGCCPEDSLEAEVVVIGSELLLGQIVDTNSALIARHFAGIGLNLFYKTTVGDNLARATAVLRQALTRADIVVTSGGIGPTADDITREAVAAATGRELVFSEDLMKQIEAYFASRGFRLSPSNRRQAFIPAGAIPVENPVGTAPAFIVEYEGKTVITLPGVPRELEYLLTRRAIPYLRDRYGLKGEIRLRVLKTVGIGESRIGELLSDFMERGTNPTVGTLAHLGQVDIRIAAKDTDPAAAARLIEPVEAEIRARLGDAVFGVDGATLEAEVGARLAATGAQVAVVEAGSAGAVAGRLVPAIPDRVAATLVLGDYAGAGVLGVDTSGGDAEARARALAAAVARWSRATVGAATYLEPVEGSTPPTVRVVLAVAVGDRVEVREHRFGGDAASIRIRAATLLLDLVRRSLAPPAA
ncbi:MAG: CinA family nicotinamide mononucleotide deamidase-related protein [Candidatus Rokubacteria bacterium]|nr:CinA family nicotinamide mononucleotide deamidase-related protein [Candidatus Rokubacteria bacterium]